MFLEIYLCKCIFFKFSKPVLFVNSYEIGGHLDYTFPPKGLSIQFQVERRRVYVVWGVRKRQEVSNDRG
jgi:hypothetical protein